MEQTVEIAGQTASIHYSGNTPGSYDPIVYLHSLQGNGCEVWEQCQSLHCSSFTLISILTPSWNDSLTPWKCEGLFAEDAPFKGNAQQHLMQLETIVAQTELQLGITPQHRCIAGYSLAGLFAAWAPFNTALFDGLASASGSLWYPGFSEYVSTNTFAKKPLCAYFSLGSKEAKTPSRLLRSVSQGTKSVVSSFQEKGIETLFESNPGNHFKEPDLRMAKGICWMLRQFDR